MMTKREIPPELLRDPAWRAALHILTSPMFEDAGGVWVWVDLQGKRTSAVNVPYDAIYDLGRRLAARRRVTK